MRCGQETPYITTKQTLPVTFYWSDTSALMVGNSDRALGPKTGSGQTYGAISLPLGPPSGVCHPALATMLTQAIIVSIAARKGSSILHGFQTDTAGIKLRPKVIASL